ncbi:hypothetical protein LDENG_00078090 [Lucifuga dentata]|nr:hypothetical protein LDENG_00078090 [Lucifuga dentata]
MIVEGTVHFNFSVKVIFSWDYISWRRNTLSSMQLCVGSVRQGYFHKKKKNPIDMFAVMDYISQACFKSLQVDFNSILE